MAVTGMADPDRLLRNDAARPGQAISLSKPLGVGVLNNRHKSTGEVFAQAIASMVTLNREAVCGRPGGRSAGRHRRHRLRPARSPVQDGPSLRRDRGDRLGRRAVSRRRAGRAGRGLRQWRHPAQPGLGPAAAATPRSRRRNCCCWPMPRPAADCCWPVRSRAAVIGEFVDRRRHASWSCADPPGLDLRDAQAPALSPRSMRSRCGTTVYRGSRAEAWPASKIPKRVQTEPASSAAPETAPAVGSGRRTGYREPRLR